MVFSRAHIGFKCITFWCWWVLKTYYLSHSKRVCSVQCIRMEYISECKSQFPDWHFIGLKITGTVQAHTFCISSSSILPLWSSLLLIHSREMTVRMLFNINIFEATCHFTLYPFITSTMTPNWINRIYFASPPTCSLARACASVWMYTEYAYSAQRKNRLDFLPLQIHTNDLENSGQFKSSF